MQREKNKLPGRIIFGIAIISIIIIAAIASGNKPPIQQEITKTLEHEALK